MKMLSIIPGANTVNNINMTYDKCYKSGGTSFSCLLRTIIGIPRNNVTNVNTPNNIMNTISAVFDYM
jgi:hypothetical protein